MTSAVLPQLCQWHKKALSHGILETLHSFLCNQKIDYCSMRYLNLKNTIKKPKFFNHDKIVVALIQFNLHVERVTASILEPVACLTSSLLGIYIMVEYHHAGSNWQYIEFAFAFRKTLEVPVWIGLIHWGFGFLIL